MKRFAFTAIAAIAAMMPVSAQELVKTLYSGDPVEVTWATPLKIGAKEFVSDVNVGNYLHVVFERTTDVIEFKSDGVWLPGTRFTFLGDSTPDVKVYITSDMLSRLRQLGLELCGASFSVKEINVCDDGFIMPNGAVWGGYFWVDNWNTMDLFKTAFDNYNGQRYLDIYLSEDNGENTGYFMKALTAWDNPDAILADNADIVHGNRIATIDLKGIDLKARLSDVNTLMIQSNPEGGSPYNITAVVLRDVSTGIDDMTGDNVGTRGCVYTLYGVKVLDNVTIDEAHATLPQGLYVANGRKIVVR